MCDCSAYTVMGTWKSASNASLAVPFRTPIDSVQNGQTGAWAMTKPSQLLCLSLGQNVQDLAF